MMDADTLSNAHKSLFEMRMDSYTNSWEIQKKYRNALITSHPPGYQFDFCDRKMTVVKHSIVSEEGYSIRIDMTCNYLNNSGEVRQHILRSDEFPMNEWINP